MKRTSSANILTALATLLLMALLAACATTSESVPEPAPQPDSEFTQPDVRDVAPMASADLSGLKTVRFQFDRAEITGDARPILRANAEFLRRTDVSVMIEGHCDERGSDEYNDALGLARAEAVRKYLGNLGVSRSKMEITSRGEKVPEVDAHTEAAYSMNRRAEFRGL